MKAYLSCDDCRCVCPSSCAPARRSRRAVRSLTKVTAILTTLAALTASPATSSAPTSSPPPAPRRLSRRPRSRRPPRRPRRPSRAPPPAPPSRRARLLLHLRRALALQARTAAGASSSRSRRAGAAVPKERARRSAPSTPEAHGRLDFSLVDGPLRLYYSTLSFLAPLPVPALSLHIPRRATRAAPCPSPLSSSPSFSSTFLSLRPLIFTSASSRRRILEG